MSTRLQAPALAALLAFAAIAPGPALARRATASHHALEHAHQPYHAYGYVHQTDPYGRYSSEFYPRMIPAPQSGRPFETDPDPLIRFEMNRDDRDRRLGGP
jgi:hypothetical protein